jgi:hypothetical protein
MKGRAKAGGEIGKNGEFYQGGQFLPNTTMGKQGRQNRKKSGRPRKSEVAPYQWEETPEGMVAIYGVIALFCKMVAGKMTVVVGDHVLDYYGFTRDSVQELADRWMAGEKWMEARR